MKLAKGKTITEMYQNEIIKCAELIIRISIRNFLEIYNLTPFGFMFDAHQQDKCESHDPEES